MVAWLTRDQDDDQAATRAARSGWAGRRCATAAASTRRCWPTSSAASSRTTARPHDHDQGRNTMAPKTTKRRSPHEGGAYSTAPEPVQRWYWKATITGPDGTAKPKVKRGYPDQASRPGRASVRRCLPAPRAAIPSRSKQPTGELPGHLARRAAAGSEHRRQLPEERPAAHRARTSARVPLASLTPGHARPALPPARARRQGRPPRGRGPERPHRQVRAHHHQQRAPRCGRMPG